MRIYKCYIPIVLFLIASNVLAATCSNPITECIEADGTRVMNGVPVTLDCWRYRTTYECREESDNNCQLLKDQRCLQISASCRVNGACAVQDEISQCSIGQYNEYEYCNEEVRPMRRICEKIPNLTIHINKDDAVDVVWYEVCREV